MRRRRPASTAMKIAETIGYSLAIFGILSGWILLAMIIFGLA